MVPILGAIGLVLREIIVFVSYVTNNSFPSPLTEKEEKEYLERLSKGDEEARQVLIERNLRLVAHVIKKFENTGEEKDDLISIGTIGLIKAINTYKVGMGTRLATYAARCIENEILMHLRMNKKNRLEVFLHDPIGVDREGNEITLLDVLGSDADNILDQVELSLFQERLYKVVKKLKNRERKILTLRFGLNGGKRKTQKEIARALGISRSYVSRIEKRVIQKVAEEMRVNEQKMR